jgi:hypothetical protein
MRNVGGGGFFLIWLVFGLGAVVAGIATAIQASKYPEWAFERAGTSKFTWQVIPIVLIFLCGPAAIVMYFVWTSKREQVAQAAASGGPPGGSGSGAPPGWEPPPGPPPVPPGPPPEPPPPPSPYGPQQ